MAAYIVVDIEVRDQPEYEKYKSVAPESIRKYGGKYLVRGGEVQTLEGEWPLQRLVMLEFPDALRARAWWNSVEYRPARELRQRAARCRMVLLEGGPAGRGED